MAIEPAYLDNSAQPVATENGTPRQRRHVGLPFAFRLIDRYIIREVISPFSVVLLVFTFMLLMDPIMLVADKLIAKGVAWSVVIRVLPTLLPQALALTIPMALLVGLLIALGRISEDREWVALQACGVSVYRLLRPVAVLGVVTWLATTYVLVWALPDGNQAYREIVVPVVMSRAQSEVKPRFFFQDFRPKVLYVRDVRPDGTWADVFLSDTSTSPPSVFLARRGQMVVDRARRTVHVVLENGTQHTGTADKYRVNDFGHTSFALDPETVFPRAEIAKGYPEMTIAELQAKAAKVRDEGFPPIEETMAIHQKFSIAVACLVFALLGLGLGVTNRKDGKMASFVLGIGVIFVYYMIMFTARSGAKAQYIPAWLAMWLPNIILGAAGVSLLVWRNQLSDRLFGLPARLASMRKGAGGASVPSRLSARRPRVIIRVRHGLIPRPRLLDWYISRGYLRVVALSFGALLGLFYIASFIDLSDRLFKGVMRPTAMLLYFIYKTPYFVYFVIPIAALVATLVTLGLLTRNSELVVMKACGISVYRASLPLVLFAVLASGMLFFLEEKILPDANRRWRTMELTFRGINTPSADMLNRGWIISRDGSSIYHYEWYNGESKEIAQLWTFSFSPASWTLKSRSYASRARYSPSLSASRGTPTWVEREGWERTFPTAEAANASFTPFRQRQVTLEQPEYFGNEAPMAEHMNYLDLKRYIAELRTGGFNVTGPLVDLQRKIAFPFVAVIMTLIAVPFGVTMGRRGALYGIGLGVMLSVVYWVTSQVFVAFGTGGLLGPVLAAWAPNILFGAGAAYLMLTVRT